MSNCPHNEIDLYANDGLEFTEICLLCKKEQKGLDWWVKANYRKDNSTGRLAREWYTTDHRINFGEYIEYTLYE